MPLCYGRSGMYRSQGPWKTCLPQSLRCSFVIAYAFSSLINSPSISSKFECKILTNMPSDSPDKCGTSQTQYRLLTPSKQHLRGGSIRLSKTEFLKYLPQIVIDCKILS